MAVERLKISKMADKEEVDSPGFEPGASYASAVDLHRIADGGRLGVCNAKHRLLPIGG